MTTKKPTKQAPASAAQFDEDARTKRKRKAMRREADKVLEEVKARWAFELDRTK
jgi:hypothetical protein